MSCNRPSIRGAPGDFSAMWVAVKLLDGKRYFVSSDNPETVARARTIALMVGGAVASLEESDGQTNILFAPPPRLQ
jgi:hypothetical protein